MSVNTELRDSAIRHALYLRRYGNGLAEKLITLLNEVDEDLIAAIAGELAKIEARGLSLPTNAQKRLQTLLERVRDVNAAAYASLDDTLFDELHSLAGVEASFQAQAIRTAIPVTIGVNVPSPNRLRAIIETSPMEGALLSSWTKGMEQGRIDRIEQAIRKGLVQGQSTDDIVRAIRGTRKLKYTDGILQISRRSAQSIARTAVTHVSNVAAQQTWKQNEKILKGWEFVATLDSRTSVTCAGLSGQIFPIGEGPIPPRHIGCRSTTVAVTKSYRELGFDADELTPSERASMDGKVAGDITFSKWLKEKGEATQLSILGPTRTQLFQSGKLDLTDFIKNDGTVISIADLKKLHNLP